MSENTRAKITQGLVNRTPPGEADFIIWDTELRGFGLKVTASGRRSFILKYRTANGTQRKPTVGTVPEITADEARRLARQWLAEATMGADPSGERQEDRKAETVKELCERFITDYAQHHKKASSVQTDRRNLDNHLIPFMGALKVKDVVRADIERLKLAVAGGKTAKAGGPTKARGRRIVTGGSGIANRVVALVSKVFACAIDWGLRTDNPARGLKKFKERPRDRFLSDAEVRGIADAMAAAEVAGEINPYAIAALRLLMLTGLRSGEVTGLRWRSVDIAGGCLHLEDTKTGARTVPLSGPAMEVLARLEREGEDDLVFRSGKPGAEIRLSRPMQLIREAAGISPDVSPHTLRHSFASWAVMGGLSLAETGALLGHRCAQTTLRYAHHNQDAMRRNADRVASTIAAMGTGNTAEIVTLRKR